MNYKNYYDNLIKRARARDIGGYLEKHHVIPRCMNGSNSRDNIVHLTPREHFIAHVLLVKIYPDNTSLIFAVNMMCIDFQKRRESKNRMYGWLKDRFAERMSLSQSGTNNSQYGKIWIYNEELKKSTKIRSEQLEAYIGKGWIKGRKILFDREPKKYIRPKKPCSSCGTFICEHPMICRKYHMIRTLIDFFGFDKTSLGTDKFYKEFARIKFLLEEEYYNNKLSTLQITEKYGLPSTQRLNSIFKSLGIQTRSLSEAGTLYWNKMGA